MRAAAVVGTAALAGALFAPSAGAQTLLQLYDAARSYDATYLSARSLYDSTVYRVEQTRALMRPSVTATTSNAVSQNNPTIGENYSSNTLGASINARQPLFNKANQASIAQAERSFVSSLADFDAAEQDLILRVANAYFDVLAAEDTLAATRANKAAISEQLASAKRNFEVGTATITDTREAQARFDLATSQEISAQNDLVTRRIALDQLVGSTGVEPRHLAVPVTLPTPPGNLEDLVARASTEHPSVRRAQVSYDVAQLETEKARAQEWPTIDAIAGISSSRGTIAANVRGNTAGGNVGVQITVPLYAGGAIQNRIKETIVLEERSRNDLEAARRVVTQQTRQAWYTLQSMAAQVKALEAAEASSQLALEATQTGYRVGIRVQVDVLNAQTQLYQTRAQLARARYDVLVGSLRLQQAAGRLTPADVRGVDAYLSR